MGRLFSGFRNLFGGNASSKLFEGKAYPPFIEEAEARSLFGGRAPTQDLPDPIFRGQSSTSQPLGSRRGLFDGLDDPWNPSKSEMTRDGLGHVY